MAPHLRPLIAGAVGGQSISDFRAKDIASSLGVEPAEITEAYNRAYSAAVAKADEVGTKAGLRDPDALYSWLEQHDLPRAMDIRDAFARSQVAPLQQAAKEYMAKHENRPASISVEELYGGSHQVNGGRLYIENGRHIVEIGDLKMTFESALLRGYVKVYEA